MACSPVIDVLLPVLFTWWMILWGNVSFSVSKWCHRWFKDRHAGKRKVKGKRRLLCDRWEPKCWLQLHLLWLEDKEDLIWTSFSRVCWFSVREAALALHQQQFDVMSLLSGGRDVTLTPTCCCLRRWRMSSSRRVSAVRSEATEISTTLTSTWAILYSPNSGIWWVISPATACSLPDLYDCPAFFHLNYIEVRHIFCYSPNQCCYLFFN